MRDACYTAWQSNYPILRTPVEVLLNVQLLELQNNSSSLDREHNRAMCRLFES